MYILYTYERVNVELFYWKNQTAYLLCLPKNEKTLTLSGVLHMIYGSINFYQFEFECEANIS